MQTQNKWAALGQSPPIELPLQSAASGWLRLNGHCGEDGPAKAFINALLLATPVVLWAGYPFFERAAESLRRRALNMFTLIALGIGCAYFYSLFALFFPQFFPAAFKANGALFLYFEPAAVITVLVLLGQLIELKARAKTGGAIQALLRRGAADVERVRCFSPIALELKGDVHGEMFARRQ